MQPQLFALYKQRMGERFDAAVMNKAHYAAKAGTGGARGGELS